MQDTCEAVRGATVQDGKIIFEGKTLETRDIHIEGIRCSGANGIIFNGRDTMLDRPVVAKLYLPKEGDGRDKRTQAIQEGRKLARLQHRNIVQVFAAYPQDVGMLIVMERLEGPNLKDYLAESRPFETRSRIWNDIEDGLKHAHKQGVMHGDLHTKNVVIEKDRAVLIDFGTSVFQSREGQSREREIQKPWELLRKLFAEEGTYRPSRADLDRMRPEDSLYGCGRAVELIEVKERVIDAFANRDDHSRKESILNLAHYYSEFPYFPPAAIFQWVTHNIPPDWHFYFFDNLEANLQARMDNKSEYQICPTPEERMSIKMERCSAVLTRTAKVLLDEARVVWD
ncbi:MAG: protein kinase [Planctomycetes bacterium]|nr:protein kinase [Planctomycetota bacterium]